MISKWFTRKIQKAVTQERERQIEKGYDLKHDQDTLASAPDHLFAQAYYYFTRGRYIEALALLDAHRAAMNTPRKVR